MDLSCNSRLVTSWWLSHPFKQIVARLKLTANATEVSFAKFPPFRQDISSSSPIHFSSKGNVGPLPNHLSMACTRGVILTIKSNCDHILQVYQQLTFEQHGTEQITQVKKDENSGVFPLNHPWINRVFHYFHHPFWGVSLFLETPKSSSQLPTFIIVFHLTLRTYPPKVQQQKAPEKWWDWKTIRLPIGFRQNFQVHLCCEILRGG